MRDLNGTSYQSSQMSIPMCAYFCQLKNYSYSGVQNGNSCFCGNSFGMYGIVFNDKECNLSCPGYSGYCGSSLPLANSIYATAASFGKNFLKTK